MSRGVKCLKAAAAATCCEEELLSQVYLKQNRLDGEFMQWFVRFEAKKIKFEPVVNSF